MSGKIYSSALGWGGEGDGCSRKRMESENETMPAHSVCPTPKPWNGKQESLRGLASLVPRPEKATLNYWLNEEIPAPMCVPS